MKDGLSGRNKSIARPPPICQVGPACGQTSVLRVGRRRRKRKEEGGDDGGGRDEGEGGVYLSLFEWSGRTMCCKWEMAMDDVDRRRRRRWWRRSGGRGPFVIGAAGSRDWSDNARRRMGHAATLTNLLPNRDLACHKYVQAGSQPMAGDVGSFAFFPEESEVIGQMCSLDRVPKCGALNPP